MKPFADEPWSPRQATDFIRSIGRNERLQLSYKRHASEQMLARGLIMGDVLFLLKYGFVHEEPSPAARKQLYRYKLEGKTPNSANRIVRAVVIPDWRHMAIKVITVMWVDEPLASS